MTFDQLAAIKDREEKERGSGTHVLAHWYTSACLLVQKYLHVDKEEKERTMLGAGAGTIRAVYYLLLLRHLKGLLLGHLNRLLPGHLKRLLAEHLDMLPRRHL
jgi:hypothetical protein